MTAADRLRGLEERLISAQRRGFTFFAGTQQALDALPALIALTEAAAYVRDAWLIIEADDAHLMNAIAKLDPALTALATALGGEQE